MRKLLIEMITGMILALMLYYGLALPFLGDTRWAAAIAAGMGGFIAMRIGKKLA